MFCPSSSNVTLPRASDLGKVCEPASLIVDDDIDSSSNPVDDMAFLQQTSFQIDNTGKWSTTTCSLTCSMKI